MCPLNLPSLPTLSSTPSPQPSSSPELSPTPEPYTLGGTLQQIQNVITGNYDHCNTPSGSLTAAVNIVNDASIPLLLIISYLLSCGFVSLITKLKNKNIKKKKL